MSEDTTNENETPQLSEKEQRAQQLLQNYANNLTKVPEDTRVVLPRDTAMVLDLHTDEAREALNSKPHGQKTRPNKNAPYKFTPNGLSTTAGDLLRVLADRLPEPAHKAAEVVIEQPVPDYLKEGAE